MITLQKYTSTHIPLHTCGEILIKNTEKVVQRCHRRQICRCWCIGSLCLCICIPSVIVCLLSMGLHVLSPCFIFVAKSAARRFRWMSACVANLALFCFGLWLNRDFWSAASERQHLWIDKYQLDVERWSHFAKIIIFHWHIQWISRNDDRPIKRHGPISN